MSPDSVAFIKALPPVLYRDLVGNGLMLRAMALVYNSLMALVPLLALSFAVLKGFGVHTHLQPFMLELLKPLGQNAYEINQRIFSFVDNVEVRALGFMGLAILIYTVISLMQQVEAAFNHTWRVKNARTLGQQLRDYLGLVMVGPLLVFIALGISTSIWYMPAVQSLSDTPLLGGALQGLFEYIPVLLIVLAFTLLYLYLPNTRVKLRAAFIGGLIAGAGWQMASWVFTTFIVKSGQQAAIYSVFAGFFFFILWVYTGWLILLTGSNIAYYVQNPRALLLDSHGQRPPPKGQLLIILVVLREITRRFQAHEAPASFDQLREITEAPAVILEPLLERLIDEGILIRDDNKTPRYLLAGSPASLTLERLFTLVWAGDPAQQREVDRLLKSNPELPEDWLACPVQEDKSATADWASQARTEGNDGSQ